MTDKYTYEIELVTSDEIDAERTQQTVAQFLDRLVQTGPFVSARLTPLDTPSVSTLSESERERLSKALEQLSHHEYAAAVEIIENLDDTNR